MLALILTPTLTRRTGWHVYAATRRRPAYPGAPPGVLPSLSPRDATSSYKAPNPEPNPNP